MNTLRLLDPRRSAAARRTSLLTASVLLAAGLVALDAEARPRPRAAGDGATARQARAARDADVWITIASADLAALEASLGADRLAGMLTRYESHEGVSVALIRESRLGDLAAAMHARFHRCGGFIAHRSRDEALDALFAPAQPPRAPALEYTIDNGPTVQAILAQTDAANVLATMQQLSAFLNRYYTSSTGVQAAQWLKSHWETIAQGRSDVKVELFPHAGWAQPSVIATIFGTDFPKEVVVIGGHLDSINTQVPSSQRPTAPAPGADDDGSGVASFTETFRAAIAAGYRPARTVKFMAYAAEEVGLRGSADIAQGYLTSKFQVIGALQLDMTDYKGSTVDMGVLTDFTNAAQTEFVRDVIDAYLAPQVTYANTACGYGCSDHASWHNRGFVASMAFESLFGQHNQALHTPNDTLATLGNNANHGLKFTKLAAAYMAELAKGTIVPPAAPANRSR